MDLGTSSGSLTEGTRRATQGGVIRPPQRARNADGYLAETTAVVGIMTQSLRPYTVNI
jgi:hypothetical protein